MENEIKRGRKKKEIDGNFAKLLSDLLQEVKTQNGIIQDDVAKAIGISRQALGKWANGETVPDILDLKKLAKYFNVSADYLFGLTGNKTNDITVKAICEYTGLSDEAVESLVDFINLDYLDDYVLCSDDYDLDQFDVKEIKKLANSLHIDNLGDPVQTQKEIEKFYLIKAQKAIEIRNNFIASDWSWDIIGFISNLNIFSERWEETIINEIHAEIKDDNSNKKLFFNKALELSRECDVLRYLITQKINEYINFYDNRIAEENERIITGGYSREKQLKEKILKEAAENGEYNPPKE